VSVEKTKEDIDQEELVSDSSTYTSTESSDSQSNAAKEQTDEDLATDETSDGVADLIRQLEEAKAQVDEGGQRLLRMQADYDNFRRRSKLEKEEFAKYASLKLVEGLLPVFDNFDRALQASKDNKDFEVLVKGIEMVYRQFDGVLRGEGVTPIESVGQPFNPEFHQAIMQVESDEFEEGTVVEEVQKGYKLGDKVIRPAMVKVSQ
jgi:molecular chaperone GrpE